MSDQLNNTAASSEDATTTTTTSTNSSVTEPLSPTVPTPSVVDPSVVGVDPSQYNLRNPAVKRLLREAAEMAAPSDQIYARPLEDNLFEWHFTIRGPPDSDYAVGVYHGRIILPPEYPMKPPSIILLTPNGRFETGTKICLSISSYHPETWRPSWSIRTALVALISFMSTDSPGAIGSLELPADSRQLLAKKSLTWECPTCGPSITHIKYRCAAGSSTGAPKAQQLFRLPHDPTEVFDSVIPPDAVARAQPNGPVRLAFDGRGGDTSDPNAVGDENGDDDDEEDLAGEPDLEHPMSTAFFNLAIGGILFCITGILLRRVFNNNLWDYMFD